MIRQLLNYSRRIYDIDSLSVELLEAIDQEINISYGEAPLRARSKTTIGIKDMVGPTPRYRYIFHSSDRNVRVPQPVMYNSIIPINIHSRSRKV